MLINICKQVKKNQKHNESDRNIKMDICLGKKCVKAAAKLENH